MMCLQPSKSAMYSSRDLQLQPSKNSGLPNIESANVTLRRELDLFANVRPVSIPEKNIDWIFYRENTEGEYALGQPRYRYN